MDAATTRRHQGSILPKPQADDCGIFFSGEHKLPDHQRSSPSLRPQPQGQNVTLWAPSVHCPWRSSVSAFPNSYFPAVH